MRKILSYFSLMMVATLCIVGNNQIVHSDMVGSMRSKSTISFDKTYIPKDEDAIIPNGSTPVTVKNNSGKSSVLPRTGENSTIGSEVAGIIIVLAAMLTKKNMKYNEYYGGKIL